MKVTIQYTWLAMLAGMVFGLSVNPAIAQESTTWTGGASGVFNQATNYDGGSPAAKNVYFNGPQNVVVEMTAGTSVHSLNIGTASTGFQMTGFNLVVHDGGVHIGDHTQATIHNRISSHGSATEMVFQVGTNSNFNLYGVLAPTTRKFYKKGAGRLYLDVGSGPASDNLLRSGTAIHIEEGILEVGDGARFEPGSAFNLQITLGTASTSAILKGGGSFVGTLTTAGIGRSLIHPAGDGSLHVRNVDASAGATFEFELGQGLLFGEGIFTGSTANEGLAFHFAGGEVGMLYTLFDYGTLVNVDMEDFVVQTAGYTVDFWNINPEDGLVQVQFSAIPEPETAVLGILSILVSMVMLRKRMRNLNR